MVLEVKINYSLKIMMGIALKLNNHLRSFKKKCFLLMWLMFYVLLYRKMLHGYLCRNLGTGTRRDRCLIIHWIFQKLEKWGSKTKGMCQEQVLATKKTSLTPLPPVTTKPTIIKMMSSIIFIRAITTTLQPWEIFIFSLIIFVENLIWDRCGAAYESFFFLKKSVC